MTAVAATFYPYATALGLWNESPAIAPAVNATVRIEPNGHVVTLNADEWETDPARRYILMKCAGYDAFKQHTYDLGLSNDVGPYLPRAWVFEGTVCKASSGSLAYLQRYMKPGRTLVIAEASPGFVAPESVD